MTQSRTERSEGQTLALLKHRQKNNPSDSLCPVCQQYMDWVDHAECAEALAPSGAQRVKVKMGEDYMAHEENPEV